VAEDAGGLAPGKDDNAVWRIIDRKDGAISHASDYNTWICEVQPMEMSTRDYLSKALIDTQERVRDFMNYSDQIEDKKLSQYFRTYAEIEGKQARQLQSFLDQHHS